MNLLTQSYVIIVTEDKKIINKEKRAKERLKIVEERRKRTYEESETVKLLHKY